MDENTANNTKLKLDVIRIDGGTQPRAETDQQAVNAYAEDMQGGAAFPPVVVFYDGTDYWLADGFHRYKAAEQIDRAKLDCDVRQGSVRDAILFSVGANASHGQRRTNEYKRRAVMRLLGDEEWGKWSDRKIAEQCGVSHNFVGDMRRICNPMTDSPRKVERNGTTYTQDTSNIGKRDSGDDTGPVLKRKPHHDEPTETETLVIDRETGEELPDAAIVKTTVSKPVAAAQPAATGITMMISRDAERAAATIADRFDRPYLRELVAALKFYI